MEASMKFRATYNIPQNTWLPMLKKWSSRERTGEHVKKVAVVG
jgi:hypothetical protein